MTLSHKINIIIVIAISSIISLMGIWETIQIRNQLESGISEVHSSIVNRFSLSLSDPLWNMDIKTIEEIVVSEMQRKEVVAVVVYNEDDPTKNETINFAAVRVHEKNNTESKLNQEEIFTYTSSNFQTYAYQSDLISLPKVKFLDHLKKIEASTDQKTKNSEIFKEDTLIAKVKIIMTVQYVNQQIRIMLWQQVFKLLVILFTIIGLLAVLLNRNITKPILELTKQAITISTGDLSQEVRNRSRKDEIGELAVRFDAMRNSIREKISNLNKEIAIREQTESRLRETENKYAELFNSIADPIIITKPDSLKILGHNDTIVNIYGWSSEELLNMYFYELHPPEEKEIILKNFRENNLSQNLDFKHITKSAEKIDVELHSSIIKYEGKAAWLTIIRNITIRKRFEAELKNHRDHLEEMVSDRTAELENEIDERLATERSLLRISKAIESTSDAVVLAEPNGDVFYINRSFKKLFGYNLQEIQNVKFRVVFKDRALAMTIFDIISKGAEWTGETEILSKDGTPIPVLIRANSVNDPSDDIIGLISIFTDITKRIKAEKTILETQQHLIENAHRAGMADIATGTLHNVGNLLNSVKTSNRVIQDILLHSAYGGLQKANALLNENFKDIENFILKDPKGIKLLQYYLKIGENFSKEHLELKLNNERLTEKIETIADVISAQQNFAGTATLIENYNLANIVNSALVMQHGTIERYGIEIQKDFQALPDIPVQKTKLMHIMINLIQNAKDAMVANSEVSENVISVATFLEDHHAIIRFADNGIGFSDETLKRMFNMGFTTKTNGHGFGLHSSANYMTEMKGEIWAESPGKNQGAAFYLKFSSPS
jgi:PAS domain S-box-containing protein